MKIRKEGYRVILVFALLCGAVWWMGYRALPHEAIYMVPMTAFVTGFLALVVAFFRDPKRVKLHDDTLLYAPCDGKVVITETVYEPEYLKRDVMQISIFMSITNVHINWSPVGGEVEYYKYHPGKFLVAWHPKSSTKNERTTTVVRTKQGVQVLFRQIAGLVARRIVSYVEVGKPMGQNDIFGFIKFGSRIDIFVPVGTQLLVGVGDKTVGSQTPIARLKNES